MYMHCTAKLRQTANLITAMNAILNKAGADYSTSFFLVRSTNLANWEERTLSNN